MLCAVCAAGSPIRIVSFVRFSVGEGLAKEDAKKLSFAEEVAQKQRETA